MVSRIVDEGWSVRAASAAAGVSERTCHKWLGRRRRGASEDFTDRSSAPRRCPRRVSERRVEEIEQLRRRRMTGPAIAQRLGMPRSTVGLMLRRLGLGKLKHLDPKPQIIRYERSRPGEMIHLDIKKLGRFVAPDHRITKDRQAGRSRAAGWDFLHVCVDDASRLAYRDLTLRGPGGHQRLPPASPGLARPSRRERRTRDDRQRLGLPLQALAKTLRQAGLRHIRTRAYTPRTNGNAERFIQTSLREWAYAQPYRSSAERSQAIGPWTNTYNLARPHAGIGGFTPWQRVNNLLGNDT